MKNSSLLIVFSLCILVFLGCHRGSDDSPLKNGNFVLVEETSYPYAFQNEGTYYFLRQALPANTISLKSTSSIDSLVSAQNVTIWNGEEYGMSNIWSPEMIRIGDSWLIYFEADDGNTDNHQLYVIENKNDDPTKGEWILHGPIITNKEWNFGIHPSSFVLNGKQYLLWSGWEHRRSETETQCIFIAEMENPWTLKSERVLISRPEYEWERQWINPDGTRTAYPIFVNENPEGTISPDGKKVIVTYSASGIWTPYKTLGLLYADSDSDLLNPESWTKLPAPQSRISPDGETMVGVSNVSIVTSPDKKHSYLLFQGHDMIEGQQYPRIYLKEFKWDKNSLPVLDLL